MQAKLKCAVYSRVSTDSQAEIEFNSCEAQEEKIRSFNTALRRAKIRDFKFHDLRHTFASHLVMAGVDITTIKELLGHKTLSMTLRYTHLAPSHKVKAVNILDSTINEMNVSIKKQII